MRVQAVGQIKTLVMIGDVLKHNPLSNPTIAGNRAKNEKNIRESPLEAIYPAPPKS